jgi:hypothetical protein
MRQETWWIEREIEVLSQKVRHFDSIESDPDQLRYI